MTDRRVERIILIGLAGVDWVALGGAMKRGLVPALSALAQRGAIGPLRTPPPLDGPQAWTSIATGLLPETHGVIAADESWAGGTRSATRVSWAMPAVWERLEEAGVPTAGIAWPASAPGAEWPGLHIDETYARPTGRSWEDWALPLHCAPRAEREALRELRVHPTDMDGATLAPFVPDLAAVDQERDPALVQLALAMAEAATVQAGAAWLLGQQDRAQAIFIHHRWLGTIRRHFTGRTAPFDRVIDGAWRFLDRLTDRLVELAGPDALVMLVSPGWGKDAGLVLAAGAGIEAKQAIQAAGALDIAPTLLSRFGLADPALPGRALAPLAGPVLRTLAPAEPRRPVPPDPALLASLSAQGYPPPPPAPRRWRVARLARFGAMVLPRAPERALEAAEAALAIEAEDIEALSLKAHALIALERPEPLAEIADALDRIAPQQPWGGLARGAYHALRGEADAAAPYLREAEAVEDAMTRLRAGGAWLVLNRPEPAGRAFKAALALDPANPNAEIGLSMAAMMLRRPVDAEMPLRRVLERDSGNAAAWAQLAAVLHAQGRKREAEQAEGIRARLA